MRWEATSGARRACVSYPDLLRHLVLQPGAAQQRRADHHSGNDDTRSHRREERGAKGQGRAGQGREDECEWMEESELRSTDKKRTTNAKLRVMLGQRSFGSVFAALQLTGCWRSSTSSRASWFSRCCCRSVADPSARFARPCLRVLIAASREGQQTSAGHRV